MSTRAVVNFYDGKSLRAKVYRHCDGYPEGLGKDLKEFLKIVKDTLSDTRFDNASYLAAKWVVHDAERFAVNYNWYAKEGEPVTTPKENRLDFLSVGIMMEDPGDIEHIYDVVCPADGSMPKIVHKKA